MLKYNYHNYYINVALYKSATIGAFSGRHGDFIFSLVYDPSNRIDQETYSSAIADIIKEIDPSAVTIDILSPLPENDEEKDN